MVIAALLGFAFGFVGSMPVAGPVAILVVGRGIEDRLRSGVYLALGAAIAESAYAYFAYWGFSELLTRYGWIEPLSRALAAVILIALGLRFTLKHMTPEARPEGADLNVGNKRSFLLGMTITALNPALMATWGAAVTMLHSLDVVVFTQASALPFSIGVCVGISSWFTLLLVLLSRHRGRFQPGTLAKLVRVMGGFLILLGLWFAFRFVEFLRSSGA